MLSSLSLSSASYSVSSFLVFCFVTMGRQARQRIPRNSCIRRNRKFRIFFIGTRCGGLITDPTGVLRSPSNSDGQYPILIDCVWMLLALYYQIVSFKFSYIDIEDGGPNCRYDRLEVRGNRLPLLSFPLSDTVKPVFRGHPREEHVLAA